MQPFQVLLVESQTFEGKTPQDFRMEQCKRVPHGNCRGCANSHEIRVNSYQISRTSDFDPFHFAGVTSHANLNRTAADLAVFDGRKTPLRRVGERRKYRSAVGAGHLDLFFEVHKNDLKHEEQEGHEVFSRK
jgi:hypothetical protein